MANHDKKTKPEPASKKEPAPKKEGAPKTENTSGAEPAKAEGGDTGGAAPAGYSRGEGQKPVTQAYKDNWNAIFGKKKKR
jgi:hypothetical protein